MKRKLALSGPICSGKSTITKMIMEYFENSEGIHFSKYAFADGVYEIARNVFGMTVKDRKLLQSIGAKMREIDKNVWAKKTINTIHQNKHNYVIIDDLRFKNELQYLLDNNFFTIRLTISKEEQLRRLKITYPTTWVQHQENLDDISEIDLNDVDDSFFNITIDVGKYTPEEIRDLIISKLIT